MWSEWKGKNKNIGGVPSTVITHLFPSVKQQTPDKKPLVTWPNQARCAVSFAYIGGLPEHADLAPPILSQLGFQATFFVDPDVVLEEAAQWKKLLGSSHEFGCSPFESQTFDGNLYGWTTAALIDELTLCKVFVRDFFEFEPLGLAHRSSQLSIGGKNASLVAQNLFKYVVTGTEGRNNGHSNVKELTVTPVISYSSNWLADLGEQREMSWIIIPFRRLYTESNSTIILHRLILESISRKRSQLWVAPVGTVAAELQRLRAN